MMIMMSLPKLLRMKAKFELHKSRTRMLKMTKPWIPPLSEICVKRCRCQIAHFCLFLFHWLRIEDLHFVPHLNYIVNYWVLRRRNFFLFSLINTGKQFNRHHSENFMRLSHLADWQISRARTWKPSSTSSTSRTKHVIQLWNSLNRLAIPTECYPWPSPRSKRRKQMNSLSPTPSRSTIYTVFPTRTPLSTALPPSRPWNQWSQ